MQDDAWSFCSERWGYSKYKVRNFLQAEWEKHNYTKAAAYSTAKMKKTAERVLDVS